MNGKSGGMTFRRSVSSLLGALPQSQRLHGLIVKADEARDRGDFDEAATLYRDVVRVNPRHAGAWVQLGNMLKDTGHFSEAEAAYFKALKIRPAHSDTLLQLGHLMNRAGRTAQAIDYYKQSLKVDRENADAFRSLAALAADSAELYSNTGLLSIAERMEAQELIGVLKSKSSQGYVLFQHSVFRGTARH